MLSHAPSLPNSEYLQKLKKRGQWQKQLLYSSLPPPQYLCSNLLKDAFFFLPKLAFKYPVSQRSLTGAVKTPICNLTVT